MKYSRITLRFRGPDRHLEERFLTDYFRRSVTMVRVALLVGLVFYAAFGVLDALLLPELKNEIWKIRYGVGCPILLLSLLFSFSRHFKRIWQPILSTALVSAGLGIIAMTILAPPPVNSSYYAGLILVLVFNYAVIRALFLSATFTGWVLVVAYWVSATQLIQTPVPTLINNLFFFIGANLLGMIGCYLSELSERKNFFLLHLLEAEREKVLASHRSLEEKVQELETAEAEIRTLSGFLPICSNCKKIRDDKGYWSRIELYISSHSQAKFSHGICPDCAEELYPEFASEPDATPS